MFASGNNSIIENIFFPGILGQSGVLIFAGFDKEMINDGIILIGVSFLLDIIIGDPVYSMHPVRLIGRWAEILEKYFIKKNMVGILPGILFWFFTAIPVLSVYLAVSVAFEYLNWHIAALLWQIFAVYSCFAFRDMMDHTRPILKSLKQDDLASARNYLRFIVGRDVDNLKKDEIIRASVESISESFVDAFLSPVLWFAAGAGIGFLIFPQQPYVFAPAAMLVYRVANTLDSMVGYRTGIYEKFGKFSARMDDVMNFIPARLSIFFLLPGIVVSRANVFSALHVFWQDRLESKSPNAAHSMSIFAGALEVSLGGETMYAGEIVKKPILGIPKKILNCEVMIKAIQIFRYSGIFLIILVLLLFYKLV